MVKLINKLVPLGLCLAALSPVASAQVPSLDARVDIDIVERDLSEVVQYLREKSGANIVVLEGGDLLVIHEGLCLLREVVEVVDLHLCPGLLESKGGLAFAVQAVAGKDEGERASLAHRMISPLSSLRYAASTASRSRR